jgi:hypothetical protein
VDTLISGLALAGISAVTYVAYRHPRAYPNICIALTGFMLAILAVLVTWDVAIGRAYIALRPHLSDENLLATAEAMERLHVPIWPLASSLGIAAYFLVLLFLPNALGHQEPPDPKDDKEGQ